ncbi:MAG: hypothetical protein KF795_32790 [Labilithrix sp.]|nr:hypothetical protein [Labilithrix sp.]
MMLTTTLVGCSLFTSLRGFDDGDDPPVELVDGAAPGDGDVDGPSPEGGSIDEAGDDAEAGDALMPNGGFEAEACTPPWMFNSSTTSVAISSTARSGAHSCRLCNIGAPMGGFMLFVSFGSEEYGPGKYTLDAYIRSDSDGQAVTGNVQLTVKGGGAPRYPSRTSPASTSGWTRVRVVEQVNANEHLAGVLVGGYSEDVGPCMLVDDISLVRE